MKIAICLVFYDDLIHLERLAVALKALDYASFDVFFLDNNPDKKHIKPFLELFPSANKIDSSENLGYAGGNNRIVQQIRKHLYDGFWILNPDMAPRADSLRLMVDTMLADERIFAAGPVICHGNTEKEPVIQLAGVKQNFFTQKKEHLYAGCKLNDLNGKEVFFVDSLNGGALLVRSEISEHQQLFEEKYFMYNDETDLLYRIRLKDKFACVVPSAIVFHHHDWSKGNRTGYYRMYYYMMRNKFLFWKKFGMNKEWITGLIKELILSPVVFSFCIRTAGPKLILYYYKGVLHGIQNKSGKARFEFN